MISLALIVRDGSCTLGRALDSARLFCEDLVVVDTGSSDDSPDLARKRGARCFAFKWCDDFSAARNFANQQARGEWIFILDADEWVDASDVSWFADAGRGDRFRVWNFMTRNYLSAVPDIPSDFQGLPTLKPRGVPQGSAGYIPSSKVRLFPANAGIRFEGLVHETVESSAARAGLLFADSPVPIHHDGYLEMPDEVKTAKAAHYHRLLKAMIGSGGALSGKLAYDYAYQCYLEGEFTESTRYFRVAFEAGICTPLRDWLWAESALKSGAVEEALKFVTLIPESHACYEALQKVLATCYEKMDKYDDALRLLRRIIRRGREDSRPLYLQMSRIYQTMGDSIMARNCLHHARGKTHP